MALWTTGKIRTQKPILRDHNEFVAKISLACGIFARRRLATGVAVSPQSRLFASRNHDFHEMTRIGHVRLHAGSRRRAALWQPGRPDLVHRVAVANVLEPDLCLQQSRLVGAVLLQQRIDLRQRLLCLAGDVLRQILGGAALQEDEIMILDSLRQDLAGLAYERSCSWPVPPLHCRALLRRAARGNKQTEVSREAGRLAPMPAASAWGWSRRPSRARSPRDNRSPCCRVHIGRTARAWSLPAAPWSSMASRDRW